MAERRMFAKTIVLSDAFLDMPLSARCLYFTLGMFADDDGFVNGPKSIMRQAGAADDDLRILILRRFILPFESGVIVIKHWRINNYLRNDRYTPTKYTDELGALSVEENGAYTEAKKDDGIPGIPSNGIPSIGKVSIDKDSEDKSIGGKSSRFVPPSVEQVSDYCGERKNGIDAQTFIDFYASKGWMIGKNKMKDWRAAVRTWERQRCNQSTPPKPSKATQDYSKGDYFEI